MELIERSGFLDSLQSEFRKVSAGEGHCVFVSGEAGIGKTSLVKTFLGNMRGCGHVYQGTCDALFTPRPLAPLYDILLQMGSVLPGSSDTADRTVFFTGLFQDLKARQGMMVIVFEDIHWADEASLDLIKFLARRISQLQCLFILTYRDDEIHSRHPLRSVLGQLSPGSFTRIQLPVLSRQAVGGMAARKGYDGDEVYSISGGNPFYVNEILASYSPGVPDNIKDAILSVYNRQDESTRQVWEMLAVLPAGFPVRYLDQLEESFARAVDQSLDTGILVMRGGLFFFKHELYRKTIETSLSSLLRLTLNRKVLLLFKERLIQDHQIEQIVHHAKNANEHMLVVHYAPVAAKQAASLGAHIEACRLYLTAIEYYQGQDPDILILFYEAYAYECYLTNQIKEGIIYTNKALDIWQKRHDTEQAGNSLRFLSRLWWYDGNSKQAEYYAVLAIEALDEQPVSRARAMAYSNMSQLKMLRDDVKGCVFWGEKAIALANELHDDEILCHALNNVGTVQARDRSNSTGWYLLIRSLEIALANSYHEHAARAYTNLGCNAVVLKEHDLARKYLNEGIQYCEARNLDSWSAYMLSMKARMELETDDWKNAYSNAETLMKNEHQPAIIRIGALTVIGTVRLRRGETDALSFLKEAKILAFTTEELQRIIPVLSAMLEYEWLTGETCIEKSEMDQAIAMMMGSDNIFEIKGFAYWLYKARQQLIPNGGTTVATDARYLYEQALSLSEGDEEGRKKAIMILHGLGATAVCAKMKMDMRSAGMRSIPRGVRKTTQANPAMLTNRELGVLQCLNQGLQNKEIASRLFISAKTVDHHISAILYKLEVPSRAKAVQEALRLGILT